MKQVILSGQGVRKRFDTNSEPVLDSVDIDLYQGDFTVIMGSSGAGKSTLLYALSGMDSLSGGKVLYRGKEISDLSEARMASLRAKDFGFVFQQTHLVSNLTLLENVAVAGYLGGGRNKAVRERAAELLQKMHVEDAVNRFPSQVSGGEAQRAALARAVINEPGLLFADEPTGALNRHHTDEVMDLLTGLNESGQSILMVTHEVRAALRGNRILYLEDGRILDAMELRPYRETDGPDRDTKLTEWLRSMGW